MMKKRRFLYIVLSLFAAMLYSCSEPTMEEDARRAADLSLESHQYSLNNDMGDAGRNDAEVQKILDKYRRLNKFDEFYQMYIEYMNENSYNMEGSMPSTETTK